jgi:hypothetical protein
MVFIYALELTQGKYYIGKTTQPGFRIDQHFQSGGSTWTTKYHPLRVIEIIPDCDDYDEDKYTRKYMDKYGIENVRGGSFCEEIFDETTLKILEKMSKSTQNKCFHCGKEGHFAKDCKKYKQPENVNDCLNFIENYIQEKKALESINPRFTRHACENPRVGETDPRLRGWGGCQQRIVKEEEERAKKQKEINEDCLPLFNAFYQAIKFMNQEL